MKNLFIRLGLSAALLSVAGSALADEKSEMFNPLQSAVPSLSIAPDARGTGTLPSMPKCRGRVVRRCHTLLG